jgi:hypothetical protein
VEDAGRYGELDALGKADRVLNFMKDFFPALRSLSVIPTPGAKSLIHADVGLARKTVAGCVGDGFSRLLSIYLAMARAQNGVVLIDEIGGGVHYKALVRLWKGILQAAREFRCQVIATTHSYETIEAAREAMSEGLFAEDFAYVRLEKGDKGVVAKTYPFPVLDAALERNWEVR